MTIDSADDSKISNRTINRPIRIESRIGRTIRNRIESRSFAGPYHNVTVTPSITRICIPDTYQVRVMGILTHKIPNVAMQSELWTTVLLGLVHKEADQLLPAEISQWRIRHLQQVLTPKLLLQPTSKQTIVSVCLLHIVTSSGMWPFASP